MALLPRFSASFGASLFSLGVSKLESSVSAVPLRNKIYISITAGLNQTYSDLCLKNGLSTEKTHTRCPDLNQGIHNTSWTSADG